MEVSLPDLIVTKEQPQQDAINVIKTVSFPVTVEDYNSGGQSLKKSQLPPIIRSPRKSYNAQAQSSPLAHREASSRPNSACQDPHKANHFTPKIPKKTSNYLNIEDHLGEVMLLHTLANGTTTTSKNQVNAGHEKNDTSIYPRLTLSVMSNDKKKAIDFGKQNLNKLKEMQDVRARELKQL